MSVFLGVFFLERNEKTINQQNTKTKKQKRTKDHKMQTRRPLSLVTEKSNTETK